MPGVLFEGGSFRPVFSCGVMDALLDENVIFPYCIGVSAGAADAASYISGQRGRNIKVFEEYRNDGRYVGKRNLIKEKSLFGIDFIFREVPNKLIPIDMKKLKSYPGDFVITVTEAESGNVKYFHKEDIDESFDVLQATCSLPVIFPPVMINGKYYYDGGLSNPIPIDKLVRDGNKKALVVLTRPKGYKKECTGKDKMAARAIEWKYPYIAKRMRTRYLRYNKAVETCEKLEKMGRIVLLRPEYPLDSFEKDVKILRQSYEAGYKMAKAHMGEIKALF